MEVPYSSSRRGQFDIQMRDPTAYEAPPDLEPFWHPLEFVSSLPLIKATIGASGTSQDVRLMIDSGKFSHLPFLGVSAGVS